MTKTHFISDAEYDDFMAEADTNPYVRPVFLVSARQAPMPKPKAWWQRLDEALGSSEVNAKRGWAGQVASERERGLR